MQNHGIVTYILDFFRLSPFGQELKYLIGKRVK